MVHQAPPPLPRHRHPSPDLDPDLLGDQRGRGIDAAKWPGGIGVVINGDDEAQYTFRHGLPGSHAVATGDHVTDGQYLMGSAWTGNSTGPHLHFAIKVGDTARCPHDLLVGAANGQPAPVTQLSRTGCVR